MSDEWLTEDPFADPDDPRARERAERRAERERKRQAKAEKEGAAPPPPAEPPKPPPPPAPKRSPEQEFWDEDPEPAPKPPEPKAAPAAGAAAGAAAGRDAAAAEGAADGEKKWSRFRRKHRKAEDVAPAAAAGAAAGAAAAQGRAEPPPSEPMPSETPKGQPAPAPSEPAAATPPKTERVAAPPKDEAPSGPPSDPAAAPTKPEAPKDPAPALPPSEPAAAAPPKTEAPAEPPNDPAPAAPPPTVEQSLPDPVPAPDDPTRPATGDHLVPDPDAPDPDAPPPAAAAAVPGDSGQTSEEWATVPAAQGDWEDFAADDYHDEGHPEMAGAARHGRRHGEDGGRRGGPLGSIFRHPFRIAAVLVLLVILWFLNSFFQPFHGDGHGRVAVRIPKGASVSEVGEILEKKGVISGGTFGIIDGSTLFQLRTALAGKRSDLISGPHVLKEDMSYGDAIDALSKEPSKKAVAGGPHEVTIPEGYTRGQAGAIVREDGVPGNYKKATVKSKFLDPAEYGGKKAKNLEGFLFPDTFQLKRKAPVKALVQLQLEDFKRRIKKVNMKYAKSKNLTVYDVVTIASMIEREAGVAKQRKLVASVIYNRLREGIPLGIDATIRFAVGNYEKPLTQTQLETDSPYNTRLNQGLPPGPINSPGLAALQAAAHPANTEFIYYVNNPNSCNELTFAKTEAEFEAAVQKYEKARETNNGNAPSTCGE